jgi:hypothetical protein
LSRLDITGSILLPPIHYKNGQPLLRIVDQTLFGSRQPAMVVLFLWQLFVYIHVTHWRYQVNKVIPAKATNIKKLTILRPGFWAVVLIVLLLLIFFATTLAYRNTSSNTATPAIVEESLTESVIEESSKWDIQVAYDAIATDMNKVQVEKVTGKSSENCTETDMGAYGRTESCFYGHSVFSGSYILVIYKDGFVQTKSKSEY